MTEAEKPIQEVFNEEEIIKAILYSDPEQDKLRNYAIQRAKRFGIWVTQ